MSTWYVKLGDRLPALTATLENADGTAADLTGGTVVTMRVRRPESGAVLFTGAGAFVGALTTGQVSYTLTAANVTTLTTDLGTAAEAVYWVEWVITFGSTGDATWPQQGYDTLHVTARL